MGTVAKDTGATRALTPAGTFNAVCVDVIDKGLQQTAFGAKDQVRIVWELDEENEQYGERFRAGATYTLSLHEKAKLCQVLEAWRGKRFSDEEKKGFDVEKLIGAPALVTIQHNPGKDGTIYANVVAVTPVPKGMPRMVASEGFVREKDKEEGWDVRSPHSKLETAATGAPMPSGDGGSYQAAGAPEYAMQGDDLPF